MGTRPQLDSCATPAPVERLAQRPGQMSFHEDMHDEWHAAMSKFLAWLDQLDEQRAA